ncbi:MAG: N-acetylmuramoyl-L-alanine amidase [Rhodobacteraceae bacterium]|nr:N-acetylmuramoyl-L-alanine amidase [Paracoccaceae bacterium]
MVVLHHTAMASAEAALARLCDPMAEVSAHYLIGSGGQVWQLVPEEARAWHAGAGAWGGVSDVNSRSIGVELDNDGLSPFAGPQMRALEALLARIMGRHAIAPQRVIAHSDLAPGRKADPGARFDWARLARLGLSVWPDAQAVAQAEAGARQLPAVKRAQAFAAAAHAFGYPALGTDPRPEAVLRAFRLRFRPLAAGPPDARDVAIARVLAACWPVLPQR